jgi:nicotinate-nucleotide adenylyltransferase
VVGSGRESVADAATCTPACFELLCRVGATRNSTGVIHTIGPHESGDFVARAAAPLGGRGSPHRANPTRQGDVMPLKSHSRWFGTLAVTTPVVATGQRIGVMGGSFNPPHVGHAMVAATALKRLQLDQLWWVVTPGNPLKSHNGLAPLADRMAACRALAASPRMHVTAFEAALATPYTAATLAYLQHRYPSATFIWVMGADNLATFHRWQQWRDIAGGLSIAVVDRPGWRLKALASPAAHALTRSRVPEARAAMLGRTGQPARWTLLSARLSHASSTALRRKGVRSS